MKTMTHTTKARAARKSDFITVKPYTVPVEWVEITVQIPANLADELDQRTAYVRSLFGSNVWTIAIGVIHTGEKFQGPANILARLKSSPSTRIFMESDLQPPLGRKLRAITITMQKPWWDGTNEAARLLGVTVSAFIRACLMERSRELRQFDRNEAARNGGVA